MDSYISSLIKAPHRSPSEGVSLSEFRGGHRHLNRLDLAALCCLQDWALGQNRCFSPSWSVATKGNLTAEDCRKQYWTGTQKMLEKKRSWSYGIRAEAVAASNLFVAV